MKLKSCLAVLLCLLCLGPIPALAAPDQGYLDVPEDAWYAGAVAEVTERGIMDGVGDGNFGPDVPVSRAMALTVLWRLQGEPEAVGDNFLDADGTWYADAALWAKAEALAQGYEGGALLGGDDPVTREQLAVFLHRYAFIAGQPVAEGALGLFSDADQVSPWASDAMRHAVGSGIFQGSEGQLEPQGVATRAALAVMLQRMLTPAVV